MGRAGAWDSDELIWKLKDLHKRGYSCAEIAKNLGAPFTRNSVAGKLHRMGLSEANRHRPEVAR